MNIDGMGESLVNQLIEKGLVKNVADNTTSRKRISSAWSVSADNRRKTSSTK